MQGYTRKETQEFVSYLKEVEDVSEFHREACIAVKASDIISQLLYKVDELEENSGRINY